MEGVASEAKWLHLSSNKRNVHARSVTGQAGGSPPRQGHTTFEKKGHGCKDVELRPSRLILVSWTQSWPYKPSGIPGNGMPVRYSTLEIPRNLQAPLQSQILQIFRNFFRENFRIFSDFCKILLNFCEISAKINKILTQICKISEIRMVQKDANLVDFEKCCKMRLCSLS